MTDSSAVANARFQLVPRPLVAPGKCAVCGTTERAVVDFGAYVDWFGAIYLCVSCLAEAAATIGMVSGDEYAEAKRLTSQSFSSYLLQNDLMVVDSEWYERAANLFGSVPVSDAYIRICGGTETVLEFREPVSIQPPLPFGEDNGTSDSPESDEFTSASGNDADSGQGNKPTRKRRSTSVPANPSDESDDGIGPILSL